MGLLYKTIIFNQAKNNFVDGNFRQVFKLLTLLPSGPANEQKTDGQYAYSSRSRAHVSPHQRVRHAQMRRGLGTRMVTCVLTKMRQSLYNIATLVFLS